MKRCSLSFSTCTHDTFYYTWSPERTLLHLYLLLLTSWQRNSLLVLIMKMNEIMIKFYQNMVIVNENKYYLFTKYIIISFKKYLLCWKKLWQVETWSGVVSHCPGRKTLCSKRFVSENPDFLHRFRIFPDFFFNLNLGNVMEIPGSQIL